VNDADAAFRVEVKTKQREILDLQPSIHTDVEELWKKVSALQDYDGYTRAHTEVKEDDKEDEEEVYALPAPE
jgi:hypothetical protein